MARAPRQWGAGGFVALGGVSFIDAAKAARIIAVEGGSPIDYAGEDCFAGSLPPMIALATTAGSGSEVTQWSVITTGKEKIRIGGGACFPR